MPLKSSTRFERLTQLVAATQKAKSRWPRSANALTKKAGGELLDLYKDNLSGSVPSTAEDPLPVGIRSGTLLEGAEMVQVNQYRADIKNDVPYSGFIEDGTYKMAPRRPLADAVEQYTGEELPNDAMEVVVDVWRE